MQGWSDITMSPDPQELLQMAERANQIYKQQATYMQDHLASLRSLVQDKENIMENLILRYDMGTLTDTDESNAVEESLSNESGEMNKVKRTILDNVKQRETISEFRQKYPSPDKKSRDLQLDHLCKQASQYIAYDQMASQNDNNQHLATVIDPQPSLESPKAMPTDGGDQNKLSNSQKLQLAEQANESYRQKLASAQDQLALVRSLILNLETIIENLMLRYDLCIIEQDHNRTVELMEDLELRRKAKALAKCTILENIEMNFAARMMMYETQEIYLLALGYIRRFCRPHTAPMDVISAICQFFVKALCDKQ